MEQINNQQETPEISETPEKKSKLVPILIISIVIVFLAIIFYLVYSLISSPSGEIYIKEVDYELFTENNKYNLLLKTTITNNGKTPISSFGIKVEIQESGTSSWIENKAIPANSEITFEKTLYPLPASIGKKVIITLDPNSKIEKLNKEKSVKEITLNLS